MQELATSMEAMGGGPIAVSTLYIGLNVLLSLVLAILVVRARVKTETELGEGDSEEMLRATRVHGNNVEYVPFALLAIIAVELAGAPVWCLHTLGAGLTVGRLAHAIGLSGNSGRSLGRFLGTILTWLVMLVAGGLSVYYALT